MSGHKKSRYEGMQKNVLSLLVILHSSLIFEFRAGDQLERRLSLPLLSHPDLRCHILWFREPQSGYSSRSHPSTGNGWMGIDPSSSLPLSEMDPLHSRRRLRRRSSSLFPSFRIFSVLQIIAVLLFMNGFFLTRYELEERSPCLPPPPSSSSSLEQNSRHPGHPSNDSHPSSPPSSQPLGNCWRHRRRYDRIILLIVDAL